MQRSPKNQPEPSYGFRISECSRLSQVGLRICLPILLAGCAVGPDFKKPAGFSRPSPSDGAKEGLTGCRAYLAPGQTGDWWRRDRRGFGVFLFKFDLHHRSGIVHFDDVGLFVNSQNFNRSVPLAFAKDIRFCLSGLAWLSRKLDFQQGPLVSQDSRNASQCNCGQRSRLLGARDRGWPQPKDVPFRDCLVRIALGVRAGTGGEQARQNTRQNRGDRPSIANQDLVNSIGAHIGAKMAHPDGSGPLAPTPGSAKRLAEARGRRGPTGPQEEGAAAGTAAVRE